MLDCEALETKTDWHREQEAHSVVRQLQWLRILKDRKWWSETIGEASDEKNSMWNGHEIGKAKQTWPKYDLSSTTVFRRSVGADRSYRSCQKPNQPVTILQRSGRCCYFFGFVLRTVICVILGNIDKRCRLFSYGSLHQMWMLCCVLLHICLSWGRDPSYVALPEVLFFFFFFTFLKRSFLHFHSSFSSLQSRHRGCRSLYRLWSPLRRCDCDFGLYKFLCSLNIRNRQHHMSVNIRPKLIASQSHWPVVSGWAKLQKAANSTRGSLE